MKAVVVELEELIKIKDEQVLIAHDESWQDLEKAEEKEMEREAARMTERGEWESEMCSKEKEVARLKKELKCSKEKEATRLSVNVRGEVWRVKERAIQTARVVEEGSGDQKRYYLTLELRKAGGKLEERAEQHATMPP